MKHAAKLMVLESTKRTTISGWRSSIRRLWRANTARSAWDAELTWTMIVTRMVRKTKISKSGDV